MRLSETGGIIGFRKSKPTKAQSLQAQISAKLDEAPALEGTEVDTERFRDIVVDLQSNYQKLEALEPVLSWLHASKKDASAADVYSYLYGIEVLKQYHIKGNVVLQELVEVLLERCSDSMAQQVCNDLQTAWLVYRAHEDKTAVSSCLMVETFAPIRDMISLQNSEGLVCGISTLGQDYGIHDEALQLSLQQHLFGRVRAHLFSYDFHDDNAQEVSTSQEDEVDTLEMRIEAFAHAVATLFVQSVQQAKSTDEELARGLSTAWKLLQPCGVPMTDLNAGLADLRKAGSHAAKMFCLNPMCTRALDACKAQIDALVNLERLGTTLNHTMSKIQTFDFKEFKDTVQDMMSPTREAMCNAVMLRVALRPLRDLCVEYKKLANRLGDASSNGCDVSKYTVEVKGMENTLSACCDFLGETRDNLLAGVLQLKPTLEAAASSMPILCDAKGALPKMFSSAKLATKLFDWAEVAPTEDKQQQMQEGDQRRDKILSALETCMKVLRDKKVADEEKSEALITLDNNDDVFEKMRVADDVREFCGILQKKVVKEITDSVGDVESLALEVFFNAPSTSNGFALNNGICNNIISKKNKKIDVSLVNQRAAYASSMKLAKQDVSIQKEEGGASEIMEVPLWIVILANPLAEFLCSICNARRALDKRVGDCGEDIAALAETTDFIGKALADAEQAVRLAHGLLLDEDCLHFQKRFGATISDMVSNYSVRLSNNLSGANGLMALLETTVKGTCALQLETLVEDADTMCANKVLAIVNSKEAKEFKKSYKSWWRAQEMDNHKFDVLLKGASEVNHVLEHVNTLKVEWATAFDKQSGVGGDAMMLWAQLTAAQAATRPLKGAETRETLVEVAKQAISKSEVYLSPKFSLMMTHACGRGVEEEASAAGQVVPDTEHTFVEALADALDASAGVRGAEGSPDKQEEEAQVIENAAPVHQVRKRAAPLWKAPLGVLTAPAEQKAEEEEGPAKMPWTRPAKSRSARAEPKVLAAPSKRQRRSAK